MAANRKEDNTEVASVKNTETMQKQKEQDSPKALTTITAREPNTNNFTYVTSEDEIQVPVPKGYVASPDAEERYVNGVTTNGVREHHGGFVIYEKNAGEADEQATVAIVENLTTAQKTRNQWVWVPISSEEVENMYYVRNSKLYGSRYLIGDNACVLVKSNVMPSVGGYYFGYRYEEPALVSSDLDHGYLKSFLSGISREELLQEMEGAFYEMLVSIKTYGGFYIGRYETGNISSKVPVVRKENGSINNVNWYLMYKRCKNLSGAKNNIQTGLIWGIEFDETFRWFVESGEKTMDEMNSVNDWGNIGNRNTQVRPTRSK